MSSFPETHALRHHFATEAQQRDTSALGMWIFLATEVLFFGGLFCTYTIYRYSYPRGFALGSSLMELTMGAINTLVLLCSSFTMALAVYSAAKDKRKSLLSFLSLTMVFGLVFLGIKFAEYYHHYQDHKVPGIWFTPDIADASAVELFFIFYFVMTGLHAVHMIVGEGLLATLLVRSCLRRFSAQYYTPVEVVGLYWHFVDVVWIFLFPLFYLVARRHL